MDSILLPEDDEFYLGDPFTPAIDPYDGTIYVSDAFSSRVVRFARTGEPIQTYGRPGDGPGELRASGLAFVLNDSTLVVEDWARQRFNFFDRNTGAYRSRTPVLTEEESAVTAGITVPVRTASAWWLPLEDRRNRRALGEWRPEEGHLRTLGSMPVEYDQSVDGGNPGYANHMSFGSLTAIGDTLVRGWQPRNDLFLYDLEGEIFDTLDIPVVRRRGVPENLRYLYDVEGATGRERITINSRLRQLHTLPDGGLAFTHHDNEILSLDGPVPVIAAHVWAGVISPDLELACVDAPVPASLDARAMEAFRGDTLFVLDRRIVDDTDLETWILMYRIDTEGCDWIPLNGVGSRDS